MMTIQQNPLNDGSRRPDEPCLAPGQDVDDVPHAERSRRTTELLTQAAGAYGEQRRALVNEAVRLNVPVARALASRYANRGQPADDLEQVASMALTVAAQGFQPSRGKDFLAYAVPTIRGELKRYFRDAAWTVRPPRRIQEMQAAISAVRAAMEQELGRSPEPAELAERLNGDVDDVREALTCDHCFSPASLDDRGRGPAGPALVDTLGERERGFEHADAVATLAPACRKLGPRDRWVVFLRFHEEWPQARIAREIGVSQMQVSRVLTRILTTLREHLCDPVPASGLAG